MRMACAIAAIALTRQVVLAAQQPPVAAVYGRQRIAGGMSFRHKFVIPGV
jgi:hypothetical protein